MNKRLFIILIALFSGTLNPSLGGVSEDYTYRPLLGKKLKHVKSIQRGAFTRAPLLQDLVDHRKHPSTRRSVFINGAQLYWGKLNDLIYGRDETSCNAVHLVNYDSFETYEGEDAEKGFLQEIRQELKSFTDSYNLKIVWNAEGTNNAPDVTKAFLNYWDQGLSQENIENIPSLEQLMRDVNPEVSQKIKAPSC